MPAEKYKPDSCPQVRRYDRAGILNSHKKSHSRKKTDVSNVDSLVTRARDGNRIAFDQLIKTFQADIYRMVYYRTRSAIDAEDLTQEIFIKAYKNLSGLKDESRFRAWLFRIGVNQVYDYFRKKRLLSVFRPFYSSSSEDGESFDTIPHKEPDALETLMKQEFWEHVGTLLKKLSHMEKEVFLLRFMDHLSIREITGVLKKSESTVKTHLYRALKKFKDEQSLLKLLKEDIP